MIEASKYSNLSVEQMNSIVLVKLNRPHKMNAFTSATLDEMEMVIDEIKNKPNIKVFILSTVSDEFFSAGVDVNWFVNMTEEEAISVSQRFQEVFGLFETLSIPVLAIVKGTCYTAGMEILYSCDMIFCTPNAKFAQLEVKFGITPGAGGTQKLVRLVGPLKAREIIYSGMPISAKEALRIGLVNHIYSKEEIDEKVMDFAHILIKNSSRAIKECKFLIQEAIYNNFEGFEKERNIFGSDFASGEPKERLNKVIEKMKTKE